jgi:serine/threonine-protein phosphatase 2A regulatory subunit B''
LFRYDNIKPEVEHQFTLKNFLSNKPYASIFFNNLLNLNKFIANEQKDPFSRSEIDKIPDYTDWDKFSHIEYLRLTAEDSDEQQEANDVMKIYLKYSK